MKTMKMLRNLAALAAALLLALTLCVPAFGETPSWGDLAMDVAVAQRAERGIADNQPLLTEDAFPAGSSVSDWTALAMAAPVSPTTTPGIWPGCRPTWSGSMRRTAAFTP